VESGAAQREIRNNWRRIRHWCYAVTAALLLCGTVAFTPGYLLWTIPDPSGVGQRQRCRRTPTTDRNPFRRVGRRLAGRGPDLALVHG
jgi:hypothetical protein